MDHITEELQGALEAWRGIVGAEQVLRDRASRTTYETATFRWNVTIPAIVRPSDRREVQECVRVANEFRCPIYPISTGRNWGLGSRAPIRDGCVVLDLSRLNRIVDYDETLGYVTVEPGVTFQQVHEFLLDRQSGFFSPAIGGPPNASLIGNALERGDGIGPTGSRWTHSCAMEVVLASGNVVETGFGRFGVASCAHTSRDGVGPSLDGLFTQSNLGVVTRMTFWLRLLPSDLRVFGTSTPDLDAAAPLLDGLRELVAEGTLEPHCATLWSSYKLLARMGRYPWRTLEGRTPLDLSRLSGSAAWYVSGALYSPSLEQGQAAEARLRDRLVSLAPDLWLQEMGARDGPAPESIYLGRPDGRNAASVYWGKQSGPVGELDPDADGCGVIWLCPEIPFRGAIVADVLSRCESLLIRSGFEPNIGAIISSPRSVRAFVAIVYDRDVEGQDRAALACHDSLIGTLVRDGYLPYRLGIQSMGALPPAPEFDRLVGALKKAMDPHGILAPGRYGN